MSDDKIKNIIASTFNAVSKKYDTNLFFKITAQEMAKSFISNNRCLLLDVSTGTGIVAFEAVKQHPRIKVVAVDISEGMLTAAKNKAKKLNIRNISFKLHDVEKLQYEAQSFDVITCGFGLFFYPNMQDTFNNLCTMIKKKGSFIFSSFNKDAFQPYSDIFLDSLEKEYQISHPKRENGLLNTKEEIIRLVQNRHDYDFNIQEVEIKYDITVNQWWELLNSAGYKSLLNQLSPEELENFKSKHLQDIKEISTNEKILLKVNSYITTLFL